jgi:hypothetical protein
MTFTTDRPFFPYREPHQESHYRAAMRLFFVGPWRAEGVLQDRAFDPAQPWRADVPFADRIQTETLSSALHFPCELGQDPWLTTFLDKADGRPEDKDLYFEASQEGVQRPAPVVDKRTLHIYGEPFILLLLPLAWWIGRPSTKRSIN